MQKMVDDSGLSDQIMIDSAGTGDWHVGDRADARMRTHANKRGLELTSISRQIQPADLADFDYIIGMDPSNIKNIKRLDKDGAFSDKIHLMVDFCSNGNYSEVPDPYFGGAAGFELVLDILEDACAGFLKVIRQERKI